MGFLSAQFNRPVAPVGTDELRGLRSVLHPVNQLRSRVQSRIG
jgi:hypothetical protein